jgi:hypothetical protein
MSSSKLIRFLCRNGADLTARDDFRWPPWYIAAENGRSEFIETLLYIEEKPRPTRDTPLYVSEVTIEYSADGIFFFLDSPCSGIRSTVCSQKNIINMSRRHVQLGNHDASEVKSPITLTIGHVDRWLDFSLDYGRSSAIEDGQPPAGGWMVVSVKNGERKEFLIPPYWSATLNQFAHVGIDPNIKAHVPEQ